MDKFQATANGTSGPVPFAGRANGAGRGRAEQDGAIPSEKPSMIAPGYEKKLDTIKDLRDKIKKNSTQGRQNFEKGWFRNILFYAGMQWITFNNGTKRWGKPSSRDLKPWIPTPVTNKFAIAVDTIKSVITQRNPRITITPETNTEENIATAEIGEDLNEVLDKESGMAEVRKSAASWVVTTGNVFAYTFYDTSEEHGQTSIDMERCNQCGDVLGPDAIEENEGACPKCGAKDFGAAVGPDGNKKSVSFPKGKLTTEARSPFEVHFNIEIQDFYKAREVVVSKTQAISELKRLYPDSKDKIVSTSSGSESKLSEYYMTAIAYVTATSTSGNSPGADKIEKAIVDEVLSLPSEDFPNGLYSVVVGDTVVFADDLQTEDATGKKYLPVAYCGGLEVPGRAWHKAPVDDLVPKQIQRNIYESLIQLSLLRMGSPDWLIPETCKVDDISGEPGQKVRYNATIQGAKPERIPGMPVNQSLFEAINMIDKEIEDLAATYDALRGDTPTGLKAFSALKLLTERGYSRHIEMIRNWEDFNKRIKIHQLEIARKHFTEPRIRTISNKNGSWETKEFTSADLQGAVNVEVESGSGVPKSQAAEQAQLMELQGANLLDMKDPRVHYKFMERMGQSDMISGVDEDVRDAGREWKDFEDSVPEFVQMQATQDPHAEAGLKLRFRAPIDNHQIHYMEHVARAKTPEFFELPQEVQDAWIAHAQMHKQEMMMEAQQQAAPAGPPAPPPGRSGQPSLPAQMRGERSRQNTLETKEPAAV